MGIIYILTSPSKKQYIGQTVRDLLKRIFEHEDNEECCMIYNAIHKYGLENFTVEVLHETDNNDELDKFEIMYIKERNTLYPNGYNIRTGGKNGLHCEASKEKMRQSKLGEKNHNFGKPRTDITKMRISIAKKGEKHHFYGKELSYDHKLNLSKAHKKDDLPMYVVRVKPRPEHYVCGGYAVINHPTLKTKYFSSKNLTDNEKLAKAMEYLNSNN
jgi:group I intron endonuclease